MRDLMQARAKTEELERKLEKSRAKVKRIRLEIARLSKAERAQRTRRLIEIGAECEKLLPALKKDRISKDEIKAVLEQAFLVSKQ